MGDKLYTVHLDGTLEVPGVSRDMLVAVEYHYEPGTGPVYARGEPLPIGPGDLPEVDVRRVLIARHRRVTFRSRSGKLVRTEAVLEGEWQDVTDLLTKMLDGDDWLEMKAEVAGHHNALALEGAAP